MRRTYLLLMATLVILFSGCNLQKHHELENAEQLMSQRPDSALKILQKYSIDDFATRSQKAHYALLLTQALDKNCVDVCNDSIIMVAVDYYTTRGSMLNRAKSYFYLGRIYKYAKDYENAIAALVKAEDYAKEVDDLYLKAQIHEDKGSLFDNQFSFKEAADEYTKSLELIRELGHTRSTIAMLEARAMAYYCDSKFDEAIADYKQALEVAIAAKDTAAILDLKSGMVSVEYQKFGNGRDAITQLRSLHKQYTDGVVPRSHFARLCRYYFDCNELDSARYYGALVLKNKITYSDIGFTGIYLMLVEIEEKSGNTNQALAYSKMAISELDSVYFTEKQRIVQKLENDNRVNLQIEKNEALRRMLIYQRLFWALSVVLAIVLLWVIGKKLKSREKKLAESQIYIETLMQNFKHLTAQLSSLNAQLNTEEEKNWRTCKFPWEKISI